MSRGFVFVGGAGTSVTLFTRSSGMSRGFVFVGGACGTFPALCGTFAALCTAFGL
jgi:hypothetical protein